MTKQFNIPKEIRAALTILNDAGFEAYLVGGCVRDLILKTEPKDWDITTNATPDEIKFANKLEDDLARRDFTVNAIAMDSDFKIIDPLNGQKDLEKKLIHAVGMAEDRFEEDALRIMRAVRLASELNFQIEDPTQKALEKKSNLLKLIAHERIRDEFSKMT